MCLGGGSGGAPQCYGLSFDGAGGVFIPFFKHHLHINAAAFLLAKYKQDMGF